MQRRDVLADVYSASFLRVRCLARFFAQFFGRFGCFFFFCFRLLYDTKSVLATILLLLYIIVMAHYHELLVSNMHCPTCSSLINNLLTPLLANPASLHVSLITRIISFELQSKDNNNLKTITETLNQAGFELEQDQSPPPPTDKILKGKGKGKGKQQWWNWNSTSIDKQREQEEQEQFNLQELERERRHRLTCKACQDESGPSSVKADVLIPIPTHHQERITILHLSGLTCTSCVSAIESALSPSAVPQIKDVQITLLPFPSKAVVTHDDSLPKEAIVEMIEDAGYEVLGIESELGKGASGRDGANDGEGHAWMETRFAIEGMTCSSCTSSLTHLLAPSSNPGIRSSTITLLPPLAIVVHDPRILKREDLTEIIEDGGYGAIVVEEKEIIDEDSSTKDAEKDTGERTVKCRVEGMFCEKCAIAINNQLATFRSAGHLITFSPLTFSSPVLSLTYIASPSFTLRSLQFTLSTLGPFTLHPLRPSDRLSALAALAIQREQRSILTRLLISFIIAIPTFIIAIVIMTLLPSSHRLRHYFDTPIWGNASRGTIALFVLSTPVQFGVGSLFYMRSWKSLKGVWRTRKGAAGAGGRWEKWWDRLFRWGSMDSLVALGTTVGWVASVAFMARDVRTHPIEGEGMGGQMSYFDSSVFLMMFILGGRWLEGMSRRKTGEAIEELAKMKVEKGLLWVGGDIGDKEGETAVDESVDSVSPQTTGTTSTQPTPIDFLEIGDTVLIPAGSSVPLDSILLPSSSPSNFDESSLTGEARPVLKSPPASNPNRRTTATSKVGEESKIYAGTTNIGPSPIFARVVRHSGSTVLDEIVRAVREAMARKAGVEKIADKITAYFVPAVIGVAVITFGIWIVRGYAGDLPKEWLGAEDSSWVLFAVQFTVAVLVVACPCGIGLAAPTAQMVGTGLAAKLGIVPYGGGEAFQNARQIDCVVFDKTGTLTKGEFSVSAHHLFLTSHPQLSASSQSFFSLVKVVEEASAHPISKGIQSFCDARSGGPGAARLIKATEVPGKGLTGHVLVGSQQFEVLIGNEMLLEENNVLYPDVALVSSLLDDWGSKGNSFVLVALRAVGSSERPKEAKFSLAGLFAVHDPPREEASIVISELERQGIAVYLCTGDNAVTALAVAKEAGISSERVFAGVLPVGKRDCIEKLQKGGAADTLALMRRRRGWWSRLVSRGSQSRAKVLFVGDGINDIVALTQSDVGVSMGTGAAVALSSSDFCLLSSNLLSLLTLLSLSRKTFNKVLSNFAWAASFNLCLIPIAAGAFYELGRTRLPPVWASLAMALSSVSVVSSSLLLKTMFRIPEVVRDHTSS
ncbi:heavy metal translocatin [Meredithblackwellia eburnea MCA 4105]